MRMGLKILSVALTALGSVAALFLLAKLLGNRQISQLSMFDYIIGISIGSIAAEMATELEEPLQPLVAMAVYALLALLIDILTRKSLAARKLISGRPIILMHGGEIYRDNLIRARLDINDYLTLCRSSGYFDVRNIETAILEENGTVSFLPREMARPATPKDFGLYPEQTKTLLPVVIDGSVISQNLAECGRMEEWLLAQLQTLGCGGPADVLCAFIDGKGELFAYPMKRKRQAGAQ